MKTKQILTVLFNISCQILVLSIYHLSETFSVTSISYSYSVRSVSSSTVSGAACRGTPGRRFPLLVVVWMSWSTYSANQQLRLETRVPPDASSWSRFGKTEKGFRHRTSKIWRLNLLGRESSRFFELNIVLCLLNWLECSWIYSTLTKNPTSGCDKLYAAHECLVFLFVNRHLKTFIFNNILR